MKKTWIWPLLLFLILSLFLLVPNVQASSYGIENFLIDATVLPNGDIRVKEIFVMNGTYNGFERELGFKNTASADLYNGSDISIISVKDINYTSLSFDTLDEEGTEFTRVSTADVGDYGKYVVYEMDDGSGYSVSIYNPSSYNGSFYIEYIIKDMAIKHKDIGELVWTVFSNQLTESVNSLKIRVNLPDNEGLKIWAHGPLYGESTIVSTEQALFEIDKLEAGTAIDVRLAFDKNILTSAIKETNGNALDTIIAEETVLADKANNQRLFLRILEVIAKITNTLIYVWFIGLIFLFRYIYKKYDKERSSPFKTKYFRDFPAEYGPETVGYLLKNNISTNEFSSTILNLIYKKIISFEAIDKKDYLLKLNIKDATLTNSETQLVEWLFKDGDFKMSKLKADARTGYDSFISKYRKWVTTATETAVTEQFYEKNSGRFKNLFYVLIGAALWLLTKVNVFANEQLSFYIPIASIGLIIYLITLKKRTEKGNEHFLKWTALKRFMQDFGRMETKDLPEIVLWEKYLVYAVTLGCADKLAKTMKIKVEELQANNSLTPNLFNVMALNSIIDATSGISKAVNTTVNTAQSAYSAAHSSNSSGGGSGGGFSSGGGSFGGGGGGGRF